jgi:hypothetical protein
MDYIFDGKIAYIFGTTVKQRLLNLTPVANFINIFLAAFATIFSSPKITKPICKREKLSKTLSYKKKLVLNVDEIDTWRFVRFLTSRDRGPASWRLTIGEVITM